MRAGRVVIGLVLLSAWAVCQQPSPDAPSFLTATENGTVAPAYAWSPFERRAFWATTAAYAAAIVADAETTRGFVRAGCFEAENPGLYGRYPARPRFYAVSAAMGVATVLVSRRLIRSKRDWSRAAGWGLLSWQVSVRAADAMHNAGLSCH